MDPVRVIKAKIRAVLETQRVNYRIWKFKKCLENKSWKSLVIIGSREGGERLRALSMVRLAGEYTK